MKTELGRSVHTLIKSWWRETILFALNIKLVWYTYHDVMFLCDIRRRFMKYVRKFTSTSESSAAPRARVNSSARYLRNTRRTRVYTATVERNRLGFVREFVVASLKTIHAWVARDSQHNNVLIGSKVCVWLHVDVGKKWQTIDLSRGLWLIVLVEMSRCCYAVRVHVGKTQRQQRCRYRRIVGRSVLIITISIRLAVDFRNFYGNTPRGSLVVSGSGKFPRETWRVQAVRLQVSERSDANKNTSVGTNK